MRRNERKHLEMNTQTIKKGGKGIGNRSRSVCNLHFTYTRVQCTNVLELVGTRYSLWQGGEDGNGC